MIHHLSAPARHPQPAGLAPVGRTAVVLFASGLSVALSACASTPPAADDAASEEEWRALATPRPPPLPGAPRLSFAGVELAAEAPWASGTVPAQLGLSELVVAGLLRRRDVEFVERRRFSAAVEAERAGLARAAAAPPAGVSRGAELTATAVWLPLPGGQAALEVRLTRSQTGAVEGAHRLAVPDDADMVGVARAVVAAILAALDELGRLPAWEDPVPDAATASYSPTTIPDAAIQSFLSGLAAEERWNWEGARRSYQMAVGSEGFVEAEAALARAARLRTGGTLGES